jgi:hypothetical protein
MRSHLRISLSAIEHNLKILRSFTEPGTKTVAGMEWFVQHYKLPEFVQW